MRRRAGRRQAPNAKVVVHLLARKRQSWVYVYNQCFQFPHLIFNFPTVSLSGMFRSDRPRKSSGRGQVQSASPKCPDI